MAAVGSLIPSSFFSAAIVSKALSFRTLYSGFCPAFCAASSKEKRAEVKSFICIKQSDAWKGGIGLTGSTNQVIVDCVEFLGHYVSFRFSEITTIQLPERAFKTDGDKSGDWILKELEEERYQSYRKSYLTGPIVASSQLRKIKQSAISSERQVEFSANVISESL